MLRGAIMSLAKSIIITLFMVLLSLSISATIVFAAGPAVSGISGIVAPGQTLEVTGSGFGVKSTVAPAVWDDCAGTDVTVLWDSALPSSAGSPYDLVYSTAYRNVTLPHSHITKYMRGAHYPAADYYSGGVVGPSHNFSVSSFPYDIYVSYYFMQDPLWDFGDGAYESSNNKIFQVTRGNEPYASEHYGYFEYYYLTSSTQTAATIHRQDDYIGWGGEWAGDAPNPTHAWHKYEWFIRLTNSSSGVIQLWIDGVPVMDYHGVTTTSGTGTYSVGPTTYAGGITFVPDVNDFRYFADLYFDNTSQRVMICNGSTWDSRGICEVQIPSVWSATSITATVNQGSFADGSNAYLYVVDANGEANSSGYPAVFVETCSEHAVTIQGGSGYYTSITAAYAAATTGQSILMQAMTFNENINLYGIDVTLKGGYNCDFTSNDGYSLISGSLTIGGSGRVQIDRLIIM
jgi:hypothetical protein